ncbi:mutator type transposase, partial [Tanacetum coccineum]
VSKLPNEDTWEVRTLKDTHTCLQSRIDFLGLDGCFLSGPYPGQILTAVGVDPNNGIYPLAYAVVESESKDS